MQQNKIDRISVLAKKARVQGLNEAEKKEQQALRLEYVAAMRTSLTAQLDEVVFVDENGRKAPMKKKPDGQ